MYETNTPLLKFIWDVSWILSLISLSIMVVLIVVHYGFHRRARAYEARYDKLKHILLIHLQTPLNNIDQLFTKQIRDIEILANLAQKILLVVDGESENRLISFIQALEIEEWICQKAMSGRNTRIRLASIQLLGYLPKNDRYTTILKNILATAENFNLKYMAAVGLSKRGDVSVFPELITAFKKLEGLSALLICDIFRNFGAAAYDFLEEIMIADTTPRNIRVAAIRALGDINIPESQKFIIPLCYNENEEVRVAAYYALSKLKQPVSKDVISYGANQASWKIKMYAADSAKYAANFPVEELTQLFKDKHWMVSRSAAEALLSYGEPGICILRFIAKQIDSVISRRARYFLNEKQDAYGAI